jgi:hypothetical protein
MSRTTFPFHGKPQLRVPILAALGLLFFAVPSSAIVNRVVESFNTTTYKDAVNTTADWNTSVGRLQFLPFQPTLQNTFDTNLALDVAVGHRYVYVADEASGVVVVDVSNPANLFSSGFYDTPGLARAVMLAGDQLFVADDVAGVQILNVHFNGSPTLTGTFNTAGTAFDVTVSGNVAYVADGTNGLVMLDVTNLSTPTLLGTYGTPGVATGVEVRGSVAYVADGASGLQLINVSNPAAPVLLGSFNTAGSAQSVDVSGKYAYVADRLNGLVILNVNNPASPTLVGAYDTPGDAFSVAISGTEAFMGDQGSGLQVVDVLNPASPTLIETFDTTGNAGGVAVANRLAFVADGTPGLRLIAVRSALPVPNEAGSLDTPDFARRLAVVGTIAYIADDDASGLQIYDISNPAAPAALGSYNTPGTAYDVVVSGTRAYVADGPAGLIILDVTSPASPVILGGFDTPGNAQGVAVSGNFAYIADGMNGAIVLNISNPAAPSMVQNIAIPNVSSGIAVSGKNVFVAHGGQGLRTFTINPSNGNLQFQGNISLGGNANYVSVVGSTVFLADGDLEIIDVTNMASPFLWATHVTPGDAQGVSVVGNFAYVADGVLGLRVIDVSNPNTPIFVSSYDTPGTALGVVAAGSRAFVADADYGLRIINVLQNQLNFSGNIGQSLALDQTADNVMYARLTANALNTTWQLTADGGANWLAATPGGPWVGVSGSDVRWKATIATVPNPPATAGASDVTVEWLYQFPVVKSIADVGHDQGNQVRITWMRSANDFVGASPQIIEYAIYRRVDAGFKPGVNTNSLSPSGAELAGWDFVTTVPAEAEDEYSVVVPTIADSTITSGQHWTAFRVRARTSTIGLFYDSYPDSGYSVDNLAPSAPNGVVVAYHESGTNALDWNDSAASDFDYFKIYRSTDPNFVPGAGNLAATTVASAWNDPDYDMAGIYYKISAVDFAGNESAASSPSATTGIGTPLVPARFILRAPGPNPFQRVTRLEFDVPQSGPRVRIDVFSVNGGLVRSLLDGPQNAGTHSVTWDGRDARGRTVPAGMYVIRMEAADFAGMHKVLLVR